MSRFIGRKQELDALNNSFEHNDGLILVSGARHIGKTSLINQFTQGKPSLHFIANEVSDELNRRNFRDLLLNNSSEDIELNNNGTPSWDELFQAYIKTNEGYKKILVLDNFDNLIQANPNFIKTITTAWNKYLKQNHITLIGALSNNSILTNLENQKNALFSSLNLRIILQPVSFLEMLRDFPSIGYRELVSLYSIVGGVPKYWDFFKNSDKTILDQLKIVNQQILNPNGFFYNLPITLIEREVWEPYYYTTIFSYLAQGINTIPELVEKTGFKTKEVTQYLNNLILLGYVQAETSVNVSKFKPKKAKYYFKNNLFRFWFKFVYPNKTYLETNKEDLVLNQIKKEFPDYVQEPFRNISQEVFEAGLKQKALDFEITKVGRFWNRTMEIPIVAIDETNKKLFLADTCFSAGDYTEGDFIHFIESTEEIKELNKYRDYERIYGLFVTDKPDKELINYVMTNPHTIIFSGTTLYKQ